MHTHLLIMAHNFPNPNIPGSCGEMSFEVSDFFEFDDWFEEDPGSSYAPESTNYTPNEIVSNLSGVGSSNSREGILNRDNRTGSKEKKENREKVAFITKSEVEVLDDGFKWRKYGKKMVKNSPNPRNYYKCSAEGCQVKKRVERNKEDPRYVITTYVGIHNHQGPGT